MTVRVSAAAWVVFLAASPAVTLGVSPAVAHERPGEPGSVRPAVILQGPQADGAQIEGADGPPSVLSEEATVSLITIGPGGVVWERFGHNAIWVRDPVRGIDRVYHWGLFSFTSEDFWPRLLQGRMLYAMGSGDPDRLVMAGTLAGRSIHVQQLRLTGGQKEELLHLLRENDTDENRYYLYDYYRDNCSTRIRDALDEVVGGVIHETLVGEGTGQSYRSHTRRLLQDVPAAYLGIQYVVGNPGDREIDRWEETFIPMALREHLGRVTLSDGSPLVLSDTQVREATAIYEPEDVKSFFVMYLAVGIVVGGLLALGGLAGRKRSWARVLFAFGAGAWAALLGIAGLTLALAWMLTEHVFWYGNENLLQISPVSLILVPFLLTLVVRPRLSRRGTQAVLAVAGLSVLGFLIQLLPGLDQVNGEIIALVLPMHLGLVLAVRLQGGG